MTGRKRIVRTRRYLFDELLNLNSDTQTCAFRTEKYFSRELRIHTDATND